MMALFRISGVFLTLTLAQAVCIESTRAEVPEKLVPLEQAILYDFEHLSLGTLTSARGPSHGEPEDISWAAAGQVEVIDGSIDGKSLEITQPASGAPSLSFELPGNATLKSGQVRFRVQLRPSELDGYRVMFRTAGSFAESYGNIDLYASGNLSVMDGAGSVVIGTYAAYELLEFTVDFDLDQGTWSVWRNGTLAVEDRAINQDLSDTGLAGLGRIAVGMPNTSTAGRTLEFDNIEILLNADGATLLDADFNDKTVSEPIGTGGAAVGEPIAISEWLETWVADPGGDGDRVLSVSKEEADGFENPYTEWAFVDSAAAQAGWLEARFDLNVSVASINHFLLVDSAGDAELLRIETTDNEQQVLVRFPDEGEGAGTVVGTYELNESMRLRIVCQMDERFCSVALDGVWVMQERSFAADTPENIAIDRFFAGMAGVSPSWSLFSLNNLRISATHPSRLPVAAEFVQQPTDTVCTNPFEPPVSVLVRDGLGEPVPGDWTLQLSEHTNVLGWGGLNIEDDPVTVDGLAEFTDVTIGRSGQGARLQAVVAGHAPEVMAISEPFDGLPGPLVNADYEGSDDDGPFVAGLPQRLWVAVYDDCNNNAPMGTKGTVLIHSGPEGASLSGNAGVVSNEWGEIELAELVFDLPGEYVLDLEIDGARLESFSDPIVIQGDRIFGDRFQIVPE